MNAGPHYAAHLRSEGESLVLESMAEGTNHAYQSNWSGWCTYCKLRGVCPFLQGETRGEKQADEEELLLFLVHVGVTMARAPGTVKQKLFSIRQMHLVGGY